LWPLDSESLFKALFHAAQLEAKSVRGYQCGLPSQIGIDGYAVLQQSKSSKPEFYEIVEVINSKVQSKSLNGKHKPKPCRKSIREIARTATGI
jgi:hypothetical protein